MQQNEFKTLEKYRLQLKDEKHELERDEKKAREDKLAHYSRSPKSKEFYSIVPAFLNELPNDILIRDFLDTDRTFAVVLPKDSLLSLRAGVNLYQNVRDVISAVTYTKVRQDGFVTLEDSEGFWIALEWR